MDSKTKIAGLLILREKNSSTSNLQRKLLLGYNRAFRILEELESIGLVGPAKGAKPRVILIKRDGEFHELCKQYEHEQETQRYNDETERY